MKTKGKVGFGLLAATVTAASVAAGYYFYASKSAKKHRRIAAKWANDFKGDVVRQARKVSNIDREALASIIDKASETYQSVRNIGPAELSRATKELKDNWRELVDELTSGGKRAKSSVKRSARKAASTSKKTVKKLSSKR